MTDTNYAPGLLSSAPGALSVHYNSPVATVKYFGDKGIQVALSTLAKWRCVGGGPRFVKLGRKPFYPDPALEEWLSEKLSREVSSTSEAA
jgi:hypothetical protein